MKQINESAINEGVEILINSDAGISTMLKEGGLLKQLTKRLVEKALQSEMDNHLWYPRYDRREPGDTSNHDNSDNGVSTKSLVTDNRDIDIMLPKERNSKFEPIIAPKCKTRIEGFGAKVLSVYAKGMSFSDIKVQIQALYGAEISESLISTITDEVMDDVKAWQSRPVDTVYSIVFFDLLGSQGQAR